MSAIIDKEEFKLLLKTKATEYDLTADDFEIMKTTGYMGSMLTELFDNTILLAQGTSNEMYEQTAMNTDSLLKLGKPLGITMSYATPANIDILMSVNAEQMITTAEDNGWYLPNGTGWYFLLDKYKTKVLIDGKYYFSFDYDIKVSIVKNTSITAALEPHLYRAAYTNEFTPEYINPLDLNNVNKDKPLSVSIIKDDNNKDYITIYTKVKQYVRDTTTIRYATTGDADLKTVVYSGLLAEFSCYYKEKDYDVLRRYINKSLFFDKTDVLKETLFWKYRDTSSFYVMTKSNGNFVPTLNSILEVEKYITLGTAGVFIYKGTNVKLVFEEMAIESNVSLLSNSVGGKDVMTMEEFRQAIILAKASRGSIINEEDLKRLYNISNGIYKIAKSRHDQYDRVYRVVIAMRNEARNMYIHTNTLDVRTLLSNIDKVFENRYYVYNDITFYSYKPGVAYAYPVTEDESVMQYRYKAPFVMVYDSQTDYVDLYEKYVRRTYPTSVVYINSDKSYSMILNKVVFAKDVGLDYMLTFNTTTTLPIADDEPLHEVASTGETVDLGKIKVKFILKNRGGIIGYLEPKMYAYTPDTGHYTYVLNNFVTDNLYKNQVELKVKQIITGEDINILAPILNLDIDVHYYLKKDDSELDTAGILQFPDTKRYTLLNTYTMKNVDLYRNLSYINRVKSSQLGNDMVVFKDVPLVGATMFDNTPNLIYDLLQFEIDKLMDIYLKTEQNYSQRMIFANTYGFSKKYKVGTAMDLDLDAISLALRFKVKLKVNSTLTELDIMEEIKAEVMKIDFNNGDVFHVSKIIDALMRNHSDIDLVEFEGINGLSTVYQYIGLINDATTQFFTPEIINVNHEYSYGLSEYIPDIVITLIT